MERTQDVLEDIGIAKLGADVLNIELLVMVAMGRGTDSYNTLRQVTREVRRRRRGTQMMENCAHTGEGNRLVLHH